MSWLAALAPLRGREMTIRIEDRAGTDPLASPVVKTLHDVRWCDEGTHLRLFVSASQFLAVPAGGEAQTSLTTEDGQLVFRSLDAEAQLQYVVTFG